ncbi:hypothetical protein IAD21_05094 [Abditibacteriota bacterium]|nr:hypothetical protein IAD21_05094 [Abditibacteriota bacterium]
MKKSLLVLVMLFTVKMALGCGTGPTSVNWQDWSIKSNEMRWLGVSHNGMPLYNLVDGDSKTAWVWSGLGGRVEKYRRGPKNLIFIREKPFWVDEVRILSGYAKNAALWKRNNRIKTLSISRNGDEGATWGREATPIKTVSLRDARGWHRILLPRREVLSVGLNILDEYKGRDNDLCVSEIEFYNRGRKIDFHMPRVVISLDGAEDSVSNEDFDAIQKQPRNKIHFPDGVVDRRSGQVISSVDSELLPDFSPDGAFAYVLDDNAPFDGYTTAQVFDVINAHRMWRRTFRYFPNYPEISWQGARRLKIAWSGKKEKPLPRQFVQF